jgi:hypothetical protein
MRLNGSFLANLLKRVIGSTKHRNCIEPCNRFPPGIVPALYDEGEKDALSSACRDEVVARGLDDSREGLWRYFVDKCRSNLHIVLAMSPVGETLRTRCRWVQGLGREACTLH